MIVWYSCRTAAERPMTEARLIPLPDYRSYPAQEMQRRAAEFYNDLRRRRSVRDFSDRAVDRSVVEDCLRAAGTAPSGANRQPWHFVVVSDNETKRRIRQAAEEEEAAFYDHAAPQAWLDAVAPFGTDANKPFLEMAPYLIVVFAEKYRVGENLEKDKNYYISESVGIATGLLICALHNAGLASLTHTPCPMRFLNEILARPENERPYLILVTGYPADDAQVPDIRRKSLEEIATFIAADSARE